MSDRLVLLDASKLDDEGLQRVVEAGEGRLEMFLRAGEERDTSQDAAKMDALKAAKDLGAISHEEYDAAMQRLVPQPFETDQAKLALLQAALDGEALGEAEFKDAVAKLHHTLGLQQGSRVEFRDNTHSEWRVGTVARMATENSRLSIFVRPDGFTTAHVWQYLRHPLADARDEAALLRDDLARVTEERDGLLQRIDRLLRDGGGGGGGEGGSRVLSSLVTPPKAKYELYGFSFRLQSTVMARVTAFSVGCRSPRPIRVTVYGSTEPLASLRADPSKWLPISEPQIIQQDPQGGTHTLTLKSPPVLAVGTPQNFLIHSPDDMRAIVYHRADAEVTAEDGCLLVLPGVAAQQSMSMAGSSYTGFSFVGSVEYTVLVCGEG